MPMDNELRHKLDHIISLLEILAEDRGLEIPPTVAERHREWLKTCGNYGSNPVRSDGFNEV